ncbi:unnamed protein product [Diplocarpon coronariae]|nr:benzoate 4-monooxygenase cytochrome P450 [Diplocarpon mali]
MLKTGETLNAVKLLHAGQRLLGIFSPMPWLITIAQDRFLVVRLRQELQPPLKPDGSLNVKELGNLEFSNGNQRDAQTASTGSRRADANPRRHSVFRSTVYANKAWRQPLDFIPKRWHSKPELIRNKTGYAPFSTGRYGCMGKNLALMGLRTVAALLLTRFDIPLAPRADGKRLLEESEDYITTALESLMLCFKAR